MASGGGVAEWPLSIILIATGIYCANANQNSNSADTGLESIVAINGVEGSSLRIHLLVISKPLPCHSLMEVETGGQPARHDDVGMQYK